MSWPLVALKDCVRVVGGATPRSDVAAFWDGDIPWTTPKDLSELDGKFLNDTPRKITAAGLKSCASEVLPPNSVLFSSRAPIGHVAINTVPMATNQGFKSMVPGPRVDASFLYWWLKCHRAQLELLGNGATFKEVSKAIVERIEIPLPPLDEQKRIAAILDQADELRRKRQQALTRLNQLGQAIFIEMFGGVSDWPTRTVGDLIDQSRGGIRTGPFGSQLLHSEFVDEGIAVLGIDNAVRNEFAWSQRRYISPSKFEKLKRYRVYPGDIIITIMGTCGRCAIVPQDIPLAINTKHLCCITLNQEVCAPEYLHSYFLNHPVALEYLRSKAKGAIMDGLNMGMIKEMPVVLPPAALQSHYKDMQRSVQQRRVQLLDALACAERLFTSLQHRAFTGQLTASALKEVAA